MSQHNLRFQIKLKIKDFLYLDLKPEARTGCKEHGPLGYNYDFGNCIANRTNKFVSSSL
jgi:hypothetical protein